MKTKASKLLVTAALAVAVPITLVSMAGASAAFADEEHTHHYSLVITDPTCTTQGYTTYTCIDCGSTYTDDYVVALGHSYAETVIQPTCTEQGYTVHFCTVCGYQYKDNYTDALGHNYSDVTVDSTCTEMGYIEHTCLTCGESYRSDYTDAIGHSYEVTDSADPTCEEEGYITYTCQNCGDEYTEIIEALGHTWSSDTEVTDPTCTEDGYTTYTCETCGETRVDDHVDALGHTYKATVTEATCVSYGYTTYTCETCVDSYISDYTSPLGHNYSVYYKVDPTEDDYGYTVYRCDNCGDTYLADFAEPGTHVHNYTSVVTDPTCTEQGYTTHSCEECGSSYKDSYTDALGHNYVSVVTDPTCTEQGYTTYTCTVCGDTYVSDYTDALGHSYAAVVTAPTCTEQGYTTFTCETCGDTYVGDYTDALGHSYKLNGISVDRTNKIVTVNYACTTCGANGAELLTLLFTDENGTITSININGTTADYSALADGFYRASLIDSEGNVLGAFTVGEENEEENNETHTHTHYLDLKTNAEAKTLTLSYKCTAEDSDLTSTLTVAFTNASGVTVNIAPDANGVVSYSELEAGAYSVQVLDSDSISLMAFSLTVTETETDEPEHVHAYYLYADVNTTAKSLSLSYTCSVDGYDATSLLKVMFIDSNGSAYAFYPDSNGLIDYSAIEADTYSVQVLDGENNLLKELEVNIAVKASEEVDMSKLELSVKIYDESKYVLVKYTAADGTDYTDKLLAVFIDTEGNAFTLAPDADGIVDYSELEAGDYTLQVIETISGDNSPVAVSSITIGESAAAHVHQYKLSVQQNNNDKTLTLSYACTEGDEDLTAYISVVFTETTTGESFMFVPDENGIVNYSELADGTYSVSVNDGDDLLIYAFSENVTIADTDIGGEVEDPGTTQEPDNTDDNNTDDNNTDENNNTDNNNEPVETENNSKTALIIGLCVTLGVIAAAVVVAIILMKKRKNKTN